MATADALAQRRLANKHKQHVMLASYVKLLRQRQPEDFPFHRATQGRWGIPQRDRALTFGPSHIRPYLGVFAQERIAYAASEDTHVAVYPGYIMTNEEYECMPFVVATASRTNLQEGVSAKWRNGFVVVGNPESPGANIMANLDAKTSNVKLAQAESSQRYRGGVGQKKRVYDSLVCIVKKTDNVIEMGGELTMTTYGNNFFSDTPDHCDECFIQFRQRYAMPTGTMMDGTPWPSAPADAVVLKCKECALQFHQACAEAMGLPHTAFTESVAFACQEHLLRPSKTETDAERKTAAEAETATEATTLNAHQLALMLCWFAPARLVVLTELIAREDVSLPRINSELAVLHPYITLRRTDAVTNDQGKMAMRFVLSDEEAAEVLVDAATLHQFQLERLEACEALRPLAISMTNFARWCKSDPVARESANKKASTIPKKWTDEWKDYLWIQVDHQAHPDVLHIVLQEVAAELPSGVRYDGVWLRPGVYRFTTLGPAEALARAEVRQQGGRRSQPVRQADPWLSDPSPNQSHTFAYSEQNLTDVLARRDTARARDNKEDTTLVYKKQRKP